MIKMQHQRVDRNNTPVLYDREIENFAHAILKDYKPKLLCEPGAIRFEHFLETYLGVTIMFKDIYNDDAEHRIFGATAFRKGHLRVFDRENTCVSIIPVEANTVVIDNFVMEPGKEGLANFTGLHEGGHILIHSDIFAFGNSSQQIGTDPSVILCRRENGESFENGNGKRTPAEWLEHHADCFAAAIAMPNSTFKPFVRRLLREHGVYKEHILLRQDMDLDILAEEILPQCIAEVYGVSKLAAFIKLKKGGFVIDSLDLRRKTNRLSV